jgi:peptidoglycan/LPS O-acetylase OafA/YrhL
VDFQLFGLLMLLLWLSKSLGLARSQARVLGPALVLLLCLASLFVFNRDADLDIWAPYYFGAYGLGALVHWLSLVSYRRLGLYLLSAAVLAALLFDFRERIALALVTAWLLAWLQQRHQGGQCLLAGRRATPLLAHLGTHSYALFLVHFPICLLVNGLFEYRDAEHAWPALLAALAALALSNLAALPFYRWVEAPAARLRVGPLLARLLPKASRS